MIRYDDINAHVVMLKDAVRTHAFELALKALVKPGMTVMDFGCGTGILSFFASRCGANTVVGVDRSVIVSVAKLLGSTNGFDNVTFIRGDELSIDLPTRFDLLVSECLGHFAIAEGMLDAFLRARDKFLVPGGVICPEQVHFYAHLVCRPEAHENLTFFETRPYGLDFSPIRDWPLCTAHVKRFGPADVYPHAIELGKVDLRSAVSQPSRFYGSCTPDRVVEVYGLAASFTAVLAKEIILETGPFSEPTHWGQVYFPLRHPLLINVGQKLDVFIEARPGSEDEMSWRWSVDSDGTRIDMDDFIHRFWLHTQCN